MLKRSVNTDNAIALFTEGKTPFLIEGPWQLTTIDESDINYEVSAVPGFEGMDPASPFITVDAAYVASGGANKTLAQEFVTNYWSRADIGAQLFEATKNVPANIDTLEPDRGRQPGRGRGGRGGVRQRPDHAEHPGDGGGLGPAGQGRGGRDRRRRPGGDDHRRGQGHPGSDGRIALALPGRADGPPRERSTAHDHVEESHVAGSTSSPPGRKAPRWGLGADGTSSPTMLMVKVIGLALVAAVALLAALPLIRSENWWGLAVVVAVTALAFYVYLSPRTVPMKYLLPGTLFLIAFQVIPVLYTVSTAFTNFGDGHRGTKEQAITAIEGASVKQVPDSTIYTLTLATDGDAATGDIVFLLSDPASQESFVGTADGLEPLEEGTFESATPGGKITAADDYTVLTVPQVNARQDDITAFSVPTDDGAIKSQGLSAAFEGAPQQSYDEECDCITDAATGNVWTADDEEGSFVSEDGSQRDLAQGWKVNVGFDNFGGSSPTTPSASPSCGSWCGTSPSRSAPWSSRSRWACWWRSRSTTR